MKEIHILVDESMFRKLVSGEIVFAAERPQESAYENLDPADAKKVIVLFCLQNIGWDLIDKAVRDAQLDR
jgi:hypothetical protein